MLETHRYVLSNFPIVLDPLVRVLEVRCALCAVDPSGQVVGNGPGHWVPLYRVKVRHDTFPFALTTAMVHFFGPSAQAEECPYLLVYDASGVIQYRIDKAREGFRLFKIPEEGNGKPVRKPSVRLTFATASDAQRVLSLVNRLQSNRVQDPVDLQELVTLLGQAEDTHFVVLAR